MIGHRWSGWQLAAPAVTMAAWGGNHYSPLLLLYRQVDGYSSVQVNLFFGCYVLGLVPGFLLAGPLSDHHGRKRPVGAALALGIAGSLVLAAGSASVVWMCVGRLVCGLSVATAMVVGTSWIKELSQDDAGPALRARRASLTLTAGFGVGAGVSGALAQWGPAPTVLPYAVQIGLSLLAAGPLWRAPETAGNKPDAAGVRGGLLAGLRIPPAGRRRFARVVVPMAPWVFGAPALAFVVAPALTAGRVAGRPVAFAALLAVLALGFGAAVQPLVPLIARRTGSRPGAVGLGLIALATAGLALGAGRLSPAAALAAAPLLGLGYGICIVAGLVEVQAMAGPDNLAGLTAIYYSLTYIGFGLPVLLAELAHRVPYDRLLAGVALACLGCLGVLLGEPGAAGAAARKASTRRPQ